MATAPFLNPSALLPDRSSSVSETVPAGFTTNAQNAGVTLIAPALASSVGAVPLRFAVKAPSTGGITLSFPDASGATQNLTVLAGEILTLRQKTSAGWGAESGNKTLASLIAYFDGRYVLQGDTTAPNVTSFTATPGDSQVALAWSGTDNVGITGWTLKRGSTTVYTGTGTGYTDTGLTNGTAYTYTLTASDAAGNVSAASTATATPQTAASGGYGATPYGTGPYGQ